MTPTRHILLATTLFAGFSALAPPISEAATTSPATQRLGATDDGGGEVVATASASQASLFLAAQSTTTAGTPAKPKADCANSTSPDCPHAVQEVVVTGSRIARTRTTTDQPVEVLTKQDIDDRGFGNLADAINTIPALGAGVTPIGGQNSFGTGRNYLDLFGLGSTHTLTLVDGLRFIGDNPNNFFSNTSGGTQVDLNALPTLFLDHIDAVYGTGAAVYGTDAVAGVVNITFTHHFVGEEFTAQSGVSTYLDIPRYEFEGAVGHDFNIGGGRLNLAVDFQYDKTNALNENDRPWLSDQLGFVSNPNPPPYEVVVPNFRYPSVTPGGVPFALDNYTPLYSGGTVGNVMFGTPIGSIVQFNSAGQLAPETLGQLYGGYTYGSASGGDGLNLAQLTSLQTPLDRKVFTAMANYTITPHVEWDTTFFYMDNVAVETANQPNYNAVFFGASPACNQPAGYSGSLAICGDNAYVTSQAAQILQANGIALTPGQTAFYLSRQNTDITPDPISSYVHSLQLNTTVKGDFSLLDRTFDWNVSASRGEAYSFFHEEGIIYGGSGTLPNGTSFNVPNLFGYALDTVLVSGQPECRAKAQNPNSTVPYIANCLPYDPFGTTNPGNAASAAYFTGAFDDKALNQQNDVVANLGATLVTLPAGDWKMNVGFEYRYDKATFTPNLNSIEGVGNSVPISAESASYSTDEYYAEMRVPIFGGGFTFPLLYRLDLDGAYRDVESTQAGTNKAWSYGAEYQPVRDLTLRYSRSKTFAAPTLGEAYSSPTGAYDVGTDPCTVSQITQGPTPATTANREKNCTAALTALGVNPATFTLDPSSNTTVPVTSGGNPDLKNEIGNSFTYGLVVQPRFVPGLTATADYIEVNITNAIEYFSLSDELAACYDAPTYPTAVCSAFQRSPTTGFVTGGSEEYINAGYERFAAVNYALTYDRAVNRFPLIGRLPFVNTSADLGRFTMNFNAVNQRRYFNSVSGTGADQVNYAGTIGNPRWRWQSTFYWTRGPWRAGWVSHYIGPSYYSLLTTTVDQLPNKLKDDLTHDASIAYKITPNLRLQFNVNNIFNTPPPSPVGTYTVGYYDFIGRYFLFSLRGKF